MADKADELADLLVGEDSGREPAAGRFSKGQFAPPNPDDWREFAAEFIATMIFVFIGAGSIVVTGTMIGDGITPASLVAIALAHGMTITVLVAATSHISGGHINPAVTFATWLAGRMDTAKGVMYVVAQLAGAIAGAYLIAAVIPDAAEGNLGAHGLGIGVSAGSGLLAEIALTFILVFVIFAVAIDPRGPQYLAPIAIGLAVFVDHLLGVTITGASMNPARSFGPALVAWDWGHHWIYWVGPGVGAALAALGYRFAFLSGIESVFEEADIEEAGVEEAGVEEAGSE